MSAPDASVVPPPDPALADQQVIGGPVTTQTSGGDYSTGGSTQEVPTPETRAALDDMTAAENAIPGAQQAVGDAQADQQGALADSQGDEAERLRRAVADRAANDQALQDRVDAATRLRQQADGEYAGMAMQGPHAKSTIQKLGLIFAGLSGNQDAVKTANASIQQGVDNEFRAQKAELDRRAEVARMRGEDVQQLYSEWEHQNGILASRQALEHDAIAAKALEMQTRMGIPLSKAQTSLTVVQQRAAAAEKRLEALRAFDRHNQAETHRQLTPTVSVSSGVRPTPQMMQGAAELQGDAADHAALGDTPLDDRELKAARRALVPRPLPKGPLESIGESVREHAPEALGGDVTGLTPESQKRVDAAVRFAQRNAHGTTSDALTAALVQASDPKARQRMMDIKRAGNPMAPRPAAAPAAKASRPATPTKIEPPPAGQLKKVRLNGVKGYLTPTGKFVPATAAPNA